MTQAMLQTPELSEAQFTKISNLVKTRAGINLHDGKRELVRSRLTKRLRQLGLDTFDQYIQRVSMDRSGAELTTMLDILSTNLTHFFRESQHFDFLRALALPELMATRRSMRHIRVWSAGCSSGEEPYTLAIVLNECVPPDQGWDVRILATDLSTQVLATAREGVYSAQRMKGTPPDLLSRYFTLTETKPEKLYKAKPAIRQMVHFARLNLMEPWPMQGPFDIIFCRNVMIYFDKPTQGQLVRRYHDVLAPGGYLFIGHSESLTGVQHDFDYVQPTVYRKL